MISEAVVIAVWNCGGVAGGFVMARIAAPELRLPGVAGGGVGAVLLAAAVAASVVPAGRAARVDVVQALRSE